MTFVNCSNHPSSWWGENQRREAGKWGEIVDVPFPQVRSESDEEEICRLAQKTVEKILVHHPEAVMCQGEFTLTYAVVRLLKEHGVPAVAASSERRTAEKVLESGKTEKTAVFEFRRFRFYE